MTTFPLYYSETIFHIKNLKKNLLVNVKQNGLTNTKDMKIRFLRISLLSLKQIKQENLHERNM